MPIASSHLRMPIASSRRTVFARSRPTVLAGSRRTVLARSRRLVRAAGPRTGGLLTALALLAGTLAGAGSAGARPWPADPSDRTAPGGSCAPSPGWTPTATDPRATGPAHAYVGNGALGVRVPPRGHGYAVSDTKTGWPLFTPRYDGAFAAGLYAVDPESGRQALAALPTWTTLDFAVGKETYGAKGTAAGTSAYRQTLFLRCGFVRTSLTWTAADGRRTDLVYDVLADRNAPQGGAVRLRITPHWNGEATVVDRIDGRGARRLAHEGGRASGRATVDVAFRAQGTGTRGAVASTLRAPGKVRQGGAARELSAAQSATFPVRSGRSYEVVKFVGVGGERTTAASRRAAIRFSQHAALRGWPALFAAHTAAWRGLWSSRIEVPGREDLQLWLRSAQYGLYAALRRGGRDSIAPTGLTSDNYAGLVFWDAETWMFPPLLATRPELARPVLDYRFATMGGARDNARRLGYKGLFFPWTSGADGGLWSECHSWRPPHCLTQVHLQSDIALAAWQYWLATGDRGWLKERGAPLLRGIAEFWADKAERNTDGSYSIRDTAGPDEYSNGVDDAVFTNAGAATSLRHAAEAVEILGGRPDPAWRRIGDRLRIPYDARRKIFWQYDGFERLRNPRIKQADTVLLMYPLEWPMPEGAAAATLDHYAALTDPDGPAMTDSVHAVDAAAIGEPGCSAYTYLQRSIRPFVRGPFALFSEARGEKAGAHDPLAGSPAQDFLTGKGGFLQVFTHGLTGLRLRPDAVRLDPTLPPQLSSGVRLYGLSWRGRTYDVNVGPRETTVRLTSGEPFTIESPQGSFRVTAADPAVLKTRRPDLAPGGSLARCRPASASSEEPGLYAAAAVDGSTATAWRPERAGAWLRVDLGRTRPVNSVSADGSHRVQTSTDGKRWEPFTKGEPVRWVRIVQTGAGPEAVTELKVD
ncbi:glycosyl hydrolase family 65 protein [Streptomyces indicus]|uniref:Trehalose and maltose hydrolase (Possible phosphorylase) n=1 Tax=Streptomyces indicus TaxID=417292 RepID=A0A1G9G0D3_9ACTN|nr:glycosyl hydrolase family 65 protein [Streptomyces indicus]SDK94089.1 Trehalose and maltose hydrolase (possible phosphorylase) [Streptomyces indicus]